MTEVYRSRPAHSLLTAVTWLLPKCTFQNREIVFSILPANPDGILLPYLPTTLHLCVLPMVPAMVLQPPTTPVSWDLQTFFSYLLHNLHPHIHNKQINCRTSKSDCLCTKFRPFKNRIGKWLRHFPIQDLFLIS